ncbi:MAG: (deoxy)nucleoside triphosphate pyrophosphohydrolase [Clostridiales bacterium]|nr:(deoxy)nucleoside triphosphate pyrophosphohydrolase [Clostridiales bacterium]
MTHLKVVGAILIFDGKILCMKRRKGQNEATSLKYEFPGGKIDPGETRTQALERELEEEMDLHLTIREEDFYQEVHHQYANFFITMYVYKCYMPSPAFVQKEHVDHRWLTPSELPELEWAPADRYVVSRLQYETV